MRVHEIAKKIGMESRLLIPELVRLGIQVSSHSNSVDDDAANGLWMLSLEKLRKQRPGRVDSSVSSNAV